MFSISQLYVFGQSNSKIANGEFIEITDVPWQISIENVELSEIGCGGSIISEEWILTAAHCFMNDFLYSDTYNYNNYKIHAGSTQYNDYSVGQVRYPSEIYLHDGFEPSTKQNDIALIKLSEPLSFNENVQPIELANECNIQQDIEGVGEFAYISGWGKTEYSDESELLKGTFIEIITQDDVGAILDEYGDSSPTGLYESSLYLHSEPTGDNNDIFVSGGIGDSGGPASLTIQNQNYLIGVYSYSENALAGVPFATPSTYTKVSSYYNWITYKSGITDFSNEISIDVEGESIIPGINPDVCYGSQVTMTAHHSGENVSYSWYKNLELISTDQSITFEATDDADIMLQVNNNGCNLMDNVSVQIISCCSAPEPALDFSSSNSSNQLYSTYEYSDIYINNTFVVDNNLTFDNCNLILGENARIIVDNAMFELMNSTISTCNEYYWDGIYLDGESDILSVVNSTFSNANNSIHAKNNAKVKVVDATFINNRVGISLTNYDDVNSNLVGVLNSNFSVDNGLLYTEAIRTEKVRGVKIGNANPLDQNSFSDLYVGLRLKNSSLEVTNSDFENIGKAAIYSSIFNEINFGDVTETPYLKVYENSFNNCTSGIVAIGMGIETNKIRSEINNNSFTNISLNSINAKNIADGTFINNNNIQNVLYGIRLSNINTNYTPVGIEVSNNTISNIVKSGIWLNSIDGGQANSINIFSNQITFNSATNYISAMRLEGLSGVMANQNTITCSGDISDNFADDIMGMFISETRKSGVYDNIFNNLGQGIHGVGELQLNKFSCNTFNDNYTGFYFESGIQTALTDQGSLTYPMDNLWNDLGVSSSNRIYEDGLAQPINWYHRGEAGFDADVNSFTSDISTDGQADGADYCVTIDIDAQINAWEQMVAAGNYTYPQYEEEYKYRDQKTVLRKVDNNPSLYLDDAVIQNFIGVMEGSDLNKVLRVDKRMSEDDLASAIIENQSLLADKLYTQNRKDVNSVYFNYMQNEGELTDHEIDLLESIAYQTPYIGGDAVYSARNLLDIDVTDEGVYYREQEPIELEEDLTVSVYPNPSNGLFKINSTQELNRVEVYNILGRLVKQVDFTAKEFELDLSSESDGIYMVKFTVSGKDVWNKVIKH